VNIKIYIAVTLPECETWSLTLREEHRLKESENRVLRRIFGRKREVVVGGWRRLHKEEIHNLYTSSNIIRVIKSRRMRWEADVARRGEMRNEYKILIGEPEEKNQLEDLGVVTII
jgi:hypothetical protein